MNPDIIPAESYPLYSNLFNPVNKILIISSRVLGVKKFKYAKIPENNIYSIIHKSSIWNFKKKDWLNNDI